MEVNDSSSFSKFKVVTAIFKPFLFNQSSKRIFQSPASFDDLKSQNGQCPTRNFSRKKAKGKTNGERQLSVCTVNVENFTPFYMIFEDGPLEFKLSFQIYSSIFYPLKFVSFLDAHSFNSCVFFYHYHDYYHYLLLLLLLLLLLIERKICNG